MNTLDVVFGPTGTGLPALRAEDKKLTASPAGGVCPMCRRRQTATACAVCSVVKHVAGRDERGRALCAVCAPRPKRPCSLCGRVRIVARRARDGKGDV